jgi:hypothetical protein
MSPLEGAHITPMWLDMQTEDIQTLTASFFQTNKSGHAEPQMA